MQHTRCAPDTMKKVPVSKGDLKRGRANDSMQYVKFKGVGLSNPQGFDNPEWKRVKCETLAGALEIGKSFKCDPDVAVAWNSELKKAWVKVDAHKHRPKFSESAWWSREKFKVKEANTMIYYYGDNETGSKAEPALKDIKEEKGPPLKKATAKAEGTAQEDFSYAVSLGSACISAKLLETCGLRGFALPFDYVVSSGEMIAHCLKDGFKEFANANQLVKKSQTAIPSQTHFGHKLYSPMLDEEPGKKESSDDNLTAVFLHHDMSDPVVRSTLSRRG